MIQGSVSFHNRERVSAFIIRVGKSRDSIVDLSPSVNHFEVNFDIPSVFL